MKKTISQIIAEFAVSTSYDDLPESAVNHVKTLTLDVLASMIGTRNVLSSRVAREIAEELGGPEEASVCGGAKKVAAPNAAYANAIQCYGFDYIDDHNESNAHPSAATFPVSLALSEAGKKSGREYITACALGNEVVAAWVRLTSGKCLTTRGSSTCVCGQMGDATSPREAHES